MQTKDRLAQEQRDAALVNCLVPPTLPARDSEPLQPEATPQDHALDDNPDEIFKSAVSELETQPLLPQPPETPWSVVIVLLAFLLSFVGGTVMALITYPTVTIEVVPVTRSISLTTPLALPTHALAPVTLTTSLTGATTGKGHQDASTASGTLTFYNGLFTAQSIPGGTVFTDSGGVKIATDAAVTIPAANPPQFAEASVPAHALRAGSAGNIAAGDISTTVANGVLVKNSQFRGGQEARDFQAVAQVDLDHVTAQLKQALSLQMPHRFKLGPGEVLQLTRCTLTLFPNRRAGEEASTITMVAAQTCDGIAYLNDELQQQASAVFIARTKPGSQYILLGTI